MPTGYTAAVQSGEITEFRDFAMQCARAMGACITMRDEPAGTPIPERFEPHTKYYDEQLAKAEARLAELKAMGPGAAERAAAAAHAEAIRAIESRTAKRDEHRRRYEAMLAKVREWTPPTDDHGGLREFMIEQLTSSIDFDTSDCGCEPPVALSWQDWLSEQIRKAEQDIGYHAKKRAEEIARTERRNEWIAALRRSLEGALDV
jgi:hypothetical protein